jgi:hypothetical protein
MTDNNLKHLLFYSNYCNYSNEIYQKILKYNIKDKFHLLNISKTKYNIPSIITSVPTLLLNDKKTIYTEDELEKFIEEEYKKIIKDEIMPTSDYMQSFSTSYSAWDENNTSINDNYNTFGFINETNKIVTPNEENGNTKDKNLSDKMNTYQENRNLDIQNIFKDKPKQL